MSALRKLGITKEDEQRLNLNLAEFEQFRSLFRACAITFRQHGYKVAISDTKQEFSIRTNVFGPQKQHSFVAGHEGDLIKMKKLAVEFADIRRFYQ